MFGWDGDTWAEEQKLTAPDAEAGDAFGGGGGHGISASSDRVLITAPGDDDIGTDAGAAYIFRWNGAKWIEQQKLTASDGSKTRFFGTSCAIAGECLVVGSPIARTGGAAYVFRFDGDSWTEEQVLVASDATEGDRFGNAVDIANGHIVVGASTDDDRGFRSGSRRDGAVSLWQRRLYSTDGPEGLRGS